MIADPRDTHRQDDFSQLDLRAEKVFAFGARPIEVGLLLDVFNVFNENNVVSRFSGTGQWDIGTGAYTPTINQATGQPLLFGTPLAIQSPRIVRLGARLRF